MGLRQFSEGILVMFSWLVIVNLVVNFAIYTPRDPYGFGQWRFDVIWDILYLRVGGPFLYGNHVITGLLVMAIPVYWAVRDGFSQVKIWLVMAFALVFEHEMIVQTMGVIVYGLPAVTRQVLSYYMAILFIFFIVALRFSDREKRNRLMWSAFLVASTSVLIGGVYLISGYHPYTLAQFAPSAAVYSFEANFFEDLHWIPAIMVWFLPRQWFQ